jgi:molybdopterin molybdotransferase
MIPVKEARNIIASQCKLLGQEVCLLKDASGRVLVEPVVALEDYPHFDNSAMDGYAANSVTTGDKGIVYDVGFEIPAGVYEEIPELEQGKVCRIFTGAPIPIGADTVVKQEDTVKTENEKKITFTIKPTSGDFVRKKGEDIKIGQLSFRLCCTQLSLHLLYKVVGRH